MKSTSSNRKLQHFLLRDVDDDYVRIVYEAVTQQSADSALTLSAFVVQ